MKALFILLFGLAISIALAASTYTVLVNHGISNNVATLADFVIAAIGGSITAYLAAEEWMRRW